MLTFSISPTNSFPSVNKVSTKTFRFRVGCNPDLTCSLPISLHSQSYVGPAKPLLAQLTVATTMKRRALKSFVLRFACSGVGVGAEVKGVQYETFETCDRYESARDWFASLPSTETPWDFNWILKSVLLLSEMIGLFEWCLVRLRIIGKAFRHWNLSDWINYF